MCFNLFCNHFIERFTNKRSIIFCSFSAYSVMSERWIHQSLSLTMPAAPTMNLQCELFALIISDVSCLPLLSSMWVVCPYYLWCELSALIISGGLSALIISTNFALISIEVRFCMFSELTVTMFHDSPRLMDFFPTKCLNMLSHNMEQ